MPLSPPTRISTQGFQVATHPDFGVGFTCLIPFTDRTPKSRASTDVKRVGVFGSSN
jgi:hypothetical protein